ncbi:ribosomal-protein-alanine N-acetyltransferase [Dermatophilus congolensis]|uniref:Ribosomal-protein-alanine N-acetyltransferase n=1 Tax=Dermatophilus congolensis TaxID=1863 RepID=A0AA46H0P9_9MICO|nr:GNAT family N-acetyltransferase [Dermatophilus congolensis]STD11043.1 ribosomal-protein-alanine N-acetyltransferase [Dermatophilus congolensis]
MNTTVLRPVHHRDIPQLTALESQVYGKDAWSESSWWGELAARPQRAYAIATPKDAPDLIYGYAGLDLGRDIADIMTITTAPHARGTGIATQLMSWMVQTATATTATHMILEVRSDNDVAIGLYTRWDFTTISTRPNYYKGADALIMRRSLSTSPEKAGQKETA